MKQQTFTVAIAAWTPRLEEMKPLNYRSAPQRRLSWLFALAATIFLCASAWAGVSQDPRQDGADQKRPPVVAKEQAQFNPPGTKAEADSLAQPEAATAQTQNLTASVATSFNYPDFGHLYGLSLNGNASQIYNRLRLTPAQYYHSGAVWSSSKQSVKNGFETVFQFQLTNLDTYYGGADGLAFVIHNSGLWAWSPRPGKIGYESLPNSLAVEFDTFLNGNQNDPNDNHLSIHTRGTGYNSESESASLGRTTFIPYLKDGRVHTVKISYMAGRRSPYYTPGRLSVFVDNFSAPALTVEVDLDFLLHLDGDSAFVGFTAGTGGGFENHDLLSWSFVGGSSSAPCTNCSPYAGTLTSAGDYDFQPNGSYYYSAVSGSHNGWLSGPAGADFDLYLQRWNGHQWETVARSERATANEQISFYGSSGYYRWVIYSYRGGGSYSFWLQRP